MKRYSELEKCEVCKSPMALLWYDFNRKINVCESDSCDFPFDQDNFEDYCETLPKKHHKLFHPEYKNQKPIEPSKLQLSKEEKDKIISQCEALIKTDPIPELPTLDSLDFNVPPLPEIQEWESAAKFYIPPEPVESTDSQESDYENSETNLSDADFFERNGSPDNSLLDFENMICATEANQTTVLESPLVKETNSVDKENATVINTEISTTLADSVSNPNNPLVESGTEFDFTSDFDYFLNLDFTTKESDQTLPQPAATQTLTAEAQCFSSSFQTDFITNPNVPDDSDFQITDSFFDDLMNGSCFSNTQNGF